MGNPASAGWTAGNVTVVQTIATSGNGFGYLTSTNNAQGLATSMAQQGQSMLGEQDRVYGRTYTKGDPNDSGLDVRLDFSVVADAAGLGGFNGNGTGSGEATSQSQNHGTLLVVANAAATSANNVQAVDTFSATGDITREITDTKTVEVRMYQYSSAATGGTGQANGKGQSNSTWSSP